MNINYKVPYHRLSIDVSNAFNPNFDAEEFRLKTREPNQPTAIWLIETNQLTDFLNAEWLEYMDSIGLPVRSFLMFYRHANQEYPEAHTDILWHTGKPYPFAVNWVFSPKDDSVMTWYDVANETGTLSITEAETKYLYWKMDQIRDRELDRLCIGNTVTMVNTGIPHNVITYNQPRWSISLRWPKHMHFETWEESVDYFYEQGLLQHAS